MNWTPEEAATYTRFHTKHTPLASMVISEREAQENAEQFAVFCAHEFGVNSDEYRAAIVAAQPVVTLYPAPLSLSLDVLHERLVNLSVACAIEWGDDSAEFAQSALLAQSVGRLLALNGVVK